MSNGVEEMVLDSVNKILRENCTKELVDDSEDGIWAEDLWRILEESSITSITAPDTLEELGGDERLAFRVLREVGKYAVPLPLAETYIANLIGFKFGALNIEDRITISISPHNQLSLNCNNVSGLLHNVPWGRVANYVLTLAERDGVSYLCLLPLSKADIKHNTNLAGEYSDEVMYENVQLTDVWYKEVNLDKVVNYTTELGGLSKAAMISGAMEETLNLSILYSKEREQFGRPLHRLQSIQHMLAKLASKAVSVSVITNEAINSLGDDRIKMDVAISKLRASALANEIAKIAHQLHGAIGVTYEHRLHQLTRRLWAWREEYGNEVFWRNELSKELLAEKEDSLWNIVTK